MKLRVDLSIILIIAAAIFFGHLAHKTAVEKMKDQPKQAASVSAEYHGESGR